MQKSRSRGFALTVALLSLTGCIDTDATVFVEATLESATLSLSQSSLAAGLDGQAVIRLDLGPRASGPSSVALVGARLTSVDGSRTLVSLQPTTDPAVPVDVPVDSEVRLSLAFARDDNAVAAEDASDLCSEQANLVVVLEGSLRGGTIDVTSGPLSLCE
ncbi:MAG: hypothetical protein AAGA56_30615 [Myxococcota bacterium]